jgi:ammonia channel protein AmtB
VCIRRPLGGGAIGAVTGYLVVVSVFFWELAASTTVGAISVHGVNGIWGVLSGGIVATGQYGAGWSGIVRDSMVQTWPFAVLSRISRLNPGWRHFST